jgi:hypothetical protein
MGGAKKVAPGVQAAAKNYGGQVKKGDFKGLAKDVYKDYLNNALMGGQGDKLAKMMGWTKVGKAPVSDPNIGGKAIKMPTYQSTTDKNGKLLAQYQLGDASPWLQTQLSAEGLTRGNNLDMANKNTLSGIGQMQSNLAMNGGISSGARERIAKQGSRDLNLSRQGVNLQGDINKLNLQSDAFEKTQDANKFNIANTLADKNAQDERKLAEYQAQMQTWAAKEQGNAISKSGKK